MSLVDVSGTVICSHSPTLLADSLSVSHSSHLSYTQEYSASPYPVCLQLSYNCVHTYYIELSQNERVFSVLFVALKQAYELSYQVKERHIVACECQCFSNYLSVCVIETKLFVDVISLIYIIIYIFSVPTFAVRTIYVDTLYDSTILDTIKKFLVFLAVYISYKKSKRIYYMQSLLQFEIVFKRQKSRIYLSLRLLDAQSYLGHKI